MSPPVEFHPRLIEETVWNAVRGRGDAGLFHRERETIYREPDPEARDHDFSRLCLAWFERLDLEKPIARALADVAHGLDAGRGLVTAGGLATAGGLNAARRILFVPATSAKREAAELFVTAGGEFTVVVALRPETLADGAAALTLLRGELLHVADMLDPAFGYEPRLPAQPAGPAHDRRLQDRYRVLWDCSIDGRLARLGHVPPVSRDARLREFQRAFACLGECAEPCFERLHSGPRPRHRELVALAADPETAFGLRASGPSSSGRCSLCAFPTADLEPSPERLPPEVERAIVAEFPEWRPEQGLCPQCADLYRARPLAACMAEP
jgi:hypothetical protein